MRAVPAVTADASPELPIVAIPVFAEFQEIRLVMSFDVLSEYTPVAARCVMVPFAITGFAGVIWIDVRAAPLSLVPAPVPLHDAR